MVSSGGTGQGPGAEGAGEVAARATWPVVACVGVAVTALVALHVDGVGTVDPIVQTLSDYVALPGGYALLGVAALALAAAVWMLGAGLRGWGLTAPAAPAALLSVASGGFVAAAVFPTNDPGTAAGPVADLHRVAGGIVLLALPLAAWMVARRAVESPAWRAAAPALTRLSVAVAALSVLFLLSNVPIVISGSPIFAVLGVLQRVLYAVMLVLLLVIARAARATAVAARTAVDLPVAAAVQATIEGPLDERLGRTA
ncbi:DUF998 domain-containing protein [Pseudonocardia humida]|uniref:DUF998 domain-containing protein n=1 Tax=Pseudonocardia humida TaxID=2800819 RepID=A0ABT0ZYT9_9PSEU|nr:DUF998 domain-containing protein [Pseudonocardia humida]MCO1655915.1 DUF998 domain-containing protein [Pseudonocardia humida]